MELKESESMSHSDGVELQRKAASASKANLSLPGDTTGLTGGASSIPASDRTTSSSEDMQGLGHLDPKTSVLLRFEGMKSTELKIILLALYALLIVGTVSLIGLIVAKNLVRKDSTWLGHNGFSKASVGMATPCLALLLGILMWGSVRIWTAWKSGKHWGMRRKRLVALAFIQTFLQTVNVAFWLTPHAHILATTCGWFDKIAIDSGLVQWTMWNTIFLTMTISAHNSNPWLEKGKAVPFRPDPLILDAPLWYHAPKLLLWCAFQGTIISEAITATTAHAHKDVCNAVSFEGACKSPLHTKIIGIVWGVLSVAYFIIYAFYNARARVRLGKLPYNRFRTGNLLHSWQRRQGKWVMNFMVGSVLFSWYSSWNHCSGYFTTWLGVFPLEIVVTGATVANAVFMFPMPASRTHPGVQTLLQGFAWSEATRKADLALRNILLAMYIKDVRKEPFFCLETALKLLTFSQVVYYDTTPPAAEKHVDVNSDALKIETLKLDVPVEASKSTQQVAKEQEDIELGSSSTAISELTRQELFTTALRLYNLQHTHIIHEEDPDTKVLIAWNDDTIVVAFRGTASMKNAMHDLQAWQTNHIPRRGRWWLGRRPKVHKGFWHSWSAHGVADRVLDYLGDLLADSKIPPSDRHVYLTGHSLGGALATLAAYDMQSRFGLKDLQVYTFGAPRTGNHAFAREYEALVPETWHVINDTDIVPRVGKFVRLYKRPGARVIVDRKGSIVVRPSALELHLRSSSSSVKAHYLKSYQGALGEVLRSQFSPLKAFVDGRRGALTLADDPHVFSYLCSTGTDLIALSKRSDEDTADSDSMSTTPEEPAMRIPAWANALVDQVVGTSLEATIARAARMTQGTIEDHDLATGNLKDNEHSKHTLPP